MRLKSVGWVILDPKTRKPLNHRLFNTFKGVSEKAAETKCPSVAEVFVKVNDDEG